MYLPLRRAAAILSRVRSAMISRSNWANENRMFSVKRPMGAAVLNCWVTDTKETPRSWKIPMMRAKSNRLRLSRSTL